MNPSTQVRTRVITFMVTNNQYITEQKVTNNFFQNFFKDQSDGGVLECYQI